MENCKRFRKHWNIRECLNLQREFELLKLSIDEIALRHKRTPGAIMFKLDEQGFADYNVLYSNYHDLNSPMDVIRKHTYDEFDGENIVNNFIDETTISDDEESETDDEEYIHDEETISDDDTYEEFEDKNYSLHKRINELESQVFTLTELVFKLNTKNTNKSVFSLFN
jgi:hypothetical protein